MRILIIDDDETQLEFIASILRADDHEVQTATSAPQALMATHQGVPDLLIVDLYLNGPDGLELRERMRAMGAIGEIPFAVISGSDSPADQQRALEAGAEAYLVKPLCAVRIRDLLAEIFPPDTVSSSRIERPTEPLPPLDAG